VKKMPGGLVITDEMACAAVVEIGWMDGDMALLDRWCDGDKPAGSALFARHFADLYRFFERKVTGEPDELVQDTFLACVRRRDEFRRQSSFRTFLFAIARFELYAYWRRRSRHGEATDFGEVSLADLATTPGTRIDRNLERERLLCALQALSLDDQLLLELHYWEGLDGDQLAEVFDISPVTSRTRLFRARQLLRERMQVAEQQSSRVTSLDDLDDWVRKLRAAARGTPAGES
jgi:RNA polymerase sigma factor (sigma-70 family)